MWDWFLDNHVRDGVAIDFFVVPTVTFRVRYVFLVMSRDRRRILHSTSRPRLRPGGPSSRCVKPFHTIPGLAICFVTVTESSAPISSPTHRSLDTDCPDPRSVELPEMGDVIAIAQLGGLHHADTTL